MIRDPSDGSVRESTKPAAGIPTTKPVLDHATSGLQTGSQKPENIAKLERSREWLRQYRIDPESVARRLGEQGT